MLKDRLAELIPAQREEIRALVRDHGDLLLSEATVSMVYGGMRGIKGLICETSQVEPDKGLVIRGIPISRLTARLPEEVYHLLLTGELPGPEALRDLQRELRERSGAPPYVWAVLRAMPEDAHPMTMISAAIVSMQRESEFARAYASGMAKTELWMPMLEDSLTLVARLPEVAAGIYRIRFRKGDLIARDPALDWGGNFARMLGIEDPGGDFASLMRLYLTLHCDHEGGNVSAHACNTIGSALSDVYYAVAGGLDGLAGPLHGLANQECLSFVLELMQRFGGVPTDEQVTRHVWDNLGAGKVVPGYGHAVLRVTDPRFTAQYEFGEARIPDSPVFATVKKLYRLVPGILKEHGKAKSPWPNVDAVSGALVFHYGLVDFSFYTVLFAVSRALGLTSQLVISRAMLSPIERPKSVSTSWLKEYVSRQGGV